MALAVHRLPNVDGYLEQAGAFLAAREAEHNLILGLCSALRATPAAFADDPPHFLTVTDGTGAVVLAALRTPPHNQILSMTDVPGAVDALADVLGRDPLPGVLGPKQVAARFVERWTMATGRSAHLSVAERIHRLDRVMTPRRPASGRWRPAEPGDRQRVADWVVAFSLEALPEEPPVEDPLGVADRWIAGLYRTVYLWEDGSEVVSIVGAGGETPNGIRIGPVYTPPEMRGRGYATSLTAAASQDQLDRGRRFCFLFTDLANPTSNKIYREIGYRPVCDVDLFRFDPPA